MESYEKTQSQKLAEAEKSKRRVQRISQVRQQANSWLSDTRQKYEAEKQRSLKELIAEVAHEVTDDAIKNLKELTSSHIAAVGEIGAAHRAAASYPNYQAIKEDKAIEDDKKAKIRYSQALNKAKTQQQQRNEDATRLQRIRESVRALEDMKSKNLVDRRPFRSRNVEHKPETLRDKLKRQGYQQSLAKTLRVPGHKGTENHPPKKRKKKTRSKKKMRSCTCPPSSHPERVAPLEIADNARADGSSRLDFHSDQHTTSTQSSPRPYRPFRPLTKKKKQPDDVQFVDANIPLPPQKYKAPPGLAVRVTHDGSTPSAWDQAKAQTEEQEKEDQRVAAKKHLIHKKTKQRGKKALKIARLEQRYKQLTNDLMTTIEEEEEDEGDSHSHLRPPAILPPTGTSPRPFDKNDFVTKLNNRYEEIMAAARSQMADLMGDEIEMVDTPQWTLPPIQLPTKPIDIQMPNTAVQKPSPRQLPASSQPSPRPLPASSAVVQVPSITVTAPDSDGVVIPNQSARTGRTGSGSGSRPGSGSGSADPGSGIGYQELHRKQEVMKAYMSVKDKLEELEAELKRRETENLAARADREQNEEEMQQEEDDGGAAIIDLISNPTPPVTQQKTKTTTPSSTEASTKPAITSGPTGNVQIQNQNVTGVGEVPSAVSTATRTTKKHSRIPRLAVKKSRSKVSTKRKRSKLALSTTAPSRKQSKQKLRTEKQQHEQQHRQQQHQQGQNQQQLNQQGQNQQQLTQERQRQEDQYQRQQNQQQQFQQQQPRQHQHQQQQGTSQQFQQQQQQPRQHQQLQGTSQQFQQQSRQHQHQQQQGTSQQFQQQQPRHHHHHHHHKQQQGTSQQFQQQPPQHQQQQQQGTSQQYQQQQSQQQQNQRLQQQQQGTSRQHPGSQGVSTNQSQGPSQTGKWKDRVSPSSGANTKKAKSRSKQTGDGQGQSQSASKSQSQTQSATTQSKMAISTEASQKILRHYIKKLLNMDPDLVAQMSTSKDSSISDSSVVQINSDVTVSSSSSSSRSSGGFNGTTNGTTNGTAYYGTTVSSRDPAFANQSPFGSNWSQFSQPQNSSTPNSHTPTTDTNWSNNVASPAGSSKPGADSTTSSSFPNVDLNLIYDSASTKSSLGSPVPRLPVLKPPLRPSGDLRSILAKVCQRQAKCLSHSISEDHEDEGEDHDGRGVDLDPDVMQRFARLLALGKEQPQPPPGSSEGSEEAADERNLRNVVSTTPTPSPLESSRSAPRSAKSKNGGVSPDPEFHLTYSPFNVAAFRHQNEIPRMIGQIADQWRQISLERPDWSDFRSDE